MGNIITGFGRSGTTYIANLLNDITDYTVLHEPRGNADELNKNNFTYYKNISKDLIKDKYIEANSYLRFWINEMENEGHKIVLLIRNPMDIFLSVCNRKPEKTHQLYLDQIANTYISFNKMKYMKFKFEDLNDEGAIDSLISFFGTKRIKETGIYNTNPNKTIKYNTIQDLPKTSKHGISRLVELETIYKETKNDYK